MYDEIERLAHRAPVASNTPVSYLLNVLVLLALRYANVRAWAEFLLVIRVISW